MIESGGDRFQVSSQSCEPTTLIEIPWIAEVCWNVPP